jgi:hypothetical protein
VDPVWYAAYGSNLSAARFACYLGGGRAEGAARTQPGCRDRAPARQDRPVEIPGQVYFAWRSPTWGGGIAFLDPLAGGRSAARAYLITREQLLDVAAQEMHREPDEQAALPSSFPASGTWSLGPGRYETVASCGEIDGLPVLTLTAPHRIADVATTRPAEGYLALMAAGLQDSHGWTAGQAADYLAGLQSS